MSMSACPAPGGETGGEPGESTAASPSTSTAPDPPVTTGGAVPTTTATADPTAAGSTTDPTGTTAASDLTTGPADTTATSDATTAETTAPVDALYMIDFDDAPLGPYAADTLAAAWQDPPWNQGVDEGRVEVFAGDGAYAGRSLRVHYPEGGVGPDEGGAQWQLVFDAGYDELYCAYRLRFADGFDFVKGGKLPGLAGGEANTGGDKPTGTDGWSARMMWREAGKIVQYTYHVDQPTDYGEDMPWDGGGERSFVAGQWHRVEHRIVMNTPGAHDGVIEGWLDGEHVFTREGLRFRDVDSFAIDLFYFSTFFGGSGSDWAPSKPEYVDFDEFIIAAAAIGH